MHFMFQSYYCARTLATLYLDIMFLQLQTFWFSFSLGLEYHSRVGVINGSWFDWFIWFLMIQSGYLSCCDLEPECWWRLNELHGQVLLWTFAKRISEDASYVLAYASKDVCLPLQPLWGCFLLRLTKCSLNMFPWGSSFFRKEVDRTLHWFNQLCVWSLWVMLTVHHNHKKATLMDPWYYVRKVKQTNKKACILHTFWDGNAPFQAHPDH